MNLRNLGRTGRAVLIGLSAVLISLVSDAFFRASDQRIYDYALSLFVHAQPNGVYSPDAVLVSVDAASEQRLGPLLGTKLRAHIPRLLRVLNEAGVPVVVFDLVFDQYDASSEQDQELRQAVAQHGAAVSATSDIHAVAPPLADAFAAIGSFELLAVGSVPRILPNTDDPRDPLPISLCAARLLGDEVSPPEHMWIDFRHPVGYFRSVSLADVVLSGEYRLADQDRTPLSVLTGKTVFVGVGTPEADRTVLPSSANKLVAGVYGHLYAYQTIRDRSWLTVPRGWSRAGITAAAVLFCACLVFLPRRLRMWSMILLVLVWACVCMILFAVPGVVMPLLPVLIGMLIVLGLDRTFVHMKLRADLHATIGFNADVLDRFRAHADRQGAGLVRKTACVLCSDIRDYTTFIQRGNPDRVAETVRAYMEEMESIVAGHGGYVNKYAGDEVVAVFGFPLSDERACDRAVSAAIEMLSAVERSAEQSRRDGTNHFARIGIGVDYGALSFLEVGSKKRQFDIIGDPANGAARLQRFTKRPGPPLLVSQEVIEQLGDTTVPQPPGDDPQGTDGRWPQHPSFSVLGPFPIRGQGERLIYQLSEDAVGEGETRR